MRSVKSLNMPLLALAIAWPLINFTIHNYSFLGYEQSGAWVILAVYFLVLLLVAVVLATVQLLFNIEISSAVRLASVIGILVFFNYPQILLFWNVVFNKINIALAPHYGYAITFLVVPMLVFAIPINRNIEKVVISFLSLVVVVSLVELFWVAANFGERLNEADNAVTPASNLDNASFALNDKGAAKPASSAITVNNPKHLQNIYHFVTDEYARRDQLLINFGFDNSEFISEMRKLGYIESRNARANYPYTAFSLSSIFAMDYIYTDDKGIQSFRKHYEFSNSDSQAVKMALELGYQFIFMGSGLSGESICEPTDRVICIAPEGSKKSRRELLVLDSLNRMTPLSYFVSINSLTTSVTNFEDVENVLAKGKLTPPYIFFAHTLPPHVPYTLKADCTVQVAIQFYLSGGLDPKKYIESLECVNHQIVHLAEYLEEHDPDAIVVFHSDHGSKFHLEETLPVDEWTRRQFDERYGVLLLTRTPETCKKYLKEDMTLINLYEFLFSCATDTEPVFLDNRFYNLNYNVNNVSDKNYGKVYQFPPDGPAN